MFKIGFIQSSSTGAPPAPPGPGDITPNPVKWEDVTHFTLSDTFIYTTKQITGVTTSVSIVLNFDPSYGITGKELFRLYFRIANTTPTLASNKYPDIAPNDLAPFYPDPVLETPLIVLNNQYVSFGVTKGTDFDTIIVGGNVISTRVIVLNAANRAYIDSFQITVDTRA